MRKALPVLVLLAFLAPPAAADITVDFSKSCAGDESPVVSLPHPNKTYGNVAGPGVFEYQLCVSGIEDSSIGSSCSGNTGFYIQSNNSYSHFSTKDSYTQHVCTSNMRTQLRNSCLSNETALLTVSGDHDAHAANPRFVSYGNVLCGFLRPTKPENVTVELRANLTGSDTVYADDTEIAAGDSIKLAEFPYIAAEGGDHFTGVVARDSISIERRLEEKNEMAVKVEREDASFMLPFTEGDHETIERHQDEVLDGSFEGFLGSSFGFFLPENPVVKVIYDPAGFNLTSSIDFGSGAHEIEIEKTGDNEVEIRQR